MSMVRAILDRPITPILSIAFAPIVGYNLWMHLKDKVGSPLVLLIPFVASTLVGYFDVKRSVLRCALILVGTAYFFGVMGAAFEAAADQLITAEAILEPVFAAVWFCGVIFPSTLVLVSIGRLVRILRR